MENDFLLISRQLVERHLQAEAVMGCQRAKHLEVINVTSVPAANGTFGQGQLAIDQALDIEELLDPQTVTGRAGAGRIVEGKQLGFQFADGVTTDRAGEAGGEDHLLEGRVIH
ncbi:hypothetical protein D3C86_1927100 [compost metagenome]